MAVGIVIYGVLVATGGVEAGTVGGVVVVISGSDTNSRVLL